MTVRHVVIPDPERPPPILDGTLKHVSNLRTRIAIGSLGVHPASLRVSGEHDLAVLELHREDWAATMDILHAHPDGPLSLHGAAVKPGGTVQAWGFPAKEHPQVQTPVISAQSRGFFVLNQALMRGYSGGPVLSVDGPAMAGVITRADDDADQTTVLHWALVTELMANDQGIEIEVPGEGVYAGKPIEVRQ
ncbi:MAG: hypothetical protein HN380_31760 [Victivallales bacterium]|nr:hypothetical protein [Victivallales bacterium]